MNENKKKKHRRALTILLVLLFTLCIMFWQGLTIKKHNQITDKIEIPIRIAFLTDLHDSYYGKNQRQLIEKIRNKNPDLIMLVGDIFDDKGSNEGAKDLLSTIGNEFPCYYVTGNHEYLSRRAEAIKETIREYGVTVLEGDTKFITVKSQKISISGIDDPYRHIFTFTNKEPTGSWQEQFNECQTEIDKDVYSILISHRPEMVQFYEDSGFDLVLTGHAHGGQFRIPFILKGLFSPNQGFFPKYTSGIYKLGNTNMIVSRGLCKDEKPRVFNSPELVIIDIKPEK